MNFQPTITLGELIAGIGMAGGSLLMYALFVIRQDKQLALLAQKVDNMGEAFKAVAHILENQVKSDLVAVAQNQRIVTIEKLLDELRHGDGMVLPRFKKSSRSFEQED